MVSGRQIFYGISMLEKYGAQLGKKRWYLISTLVDESFSLNYMAKIPDHLDKAGICSLSVFICTFIGLSVRD